MTKNTNKWRKTGLLDGLEESKCKACSDALEECAYLSFKNAKIIDDEIFFVTIFLIIRRLFEEKDYTIPSIKFIFEDYLKYYKNYTSFKKLKLDHDIDIESEFMQLYILKLNPNHKLV